MTLARWLQRLPCEALPLWPYDSQPSFLDTDPLSEVHLGLPVGDGALAGRGRSAREEKPATRLTAAAVTIE
jgi:hypothetical protein